MVSFRPFSFNVGPMVQSSVGFGSSSSRYEFISLYVDIISLFVRTLSSQEFYLRVTKVDVNKR